MSDCVCQRRKINQGSLHYIKIIAADYFRWDVKKRPPCILTLDLRQIHEIQGVNEGYIPFYLPRSK